MHLSRFRFIAALCLFCLGWGASLRADTLSGTVKDPAGLTVAGARIEITGEGLPQPLILTSDEAGKFVARDLKPGKYSVHVSKEGFQPLDTSAELRGTADLSLTLAIAQQQTTVTVNEKTLAYANSDLTTASFATSSWAPPTARTISPCPSTSAPSSSNPARSRFWLQ